MTDHGIITPVTVEEFGQRVRAARRAKRLSRQALEQLSGVKVITLERLEGTQPPTPKRTTVIDLAQALGWDVDRTLGGLGHEPLTADERTELAKRNSPRAQLDRLLDELPEAVLVGFLTLGRAILHPRNRQGGDNAEDSTDDPEATYHGRRHIAEEAPPVHELSAEERGAARPQSAAETPENGPAASS
jgi:transcriptional regulator with XRE-family HTH domain